LFEICLIKLNSNHQGNRSTIKIWEVGEEQRTFYASYIACKGDWPWIRKAYSLSSGFRSRRVCHLCEGVESYINFRDQSVLFDLMLMQMPITICCNKLLRSATCKDWWDVTPSGFVRSLGEGAPNPCPFKQTGTASPLRFVPGGSDPSVIKPDLMHAFNIGIGGDMAASALIALCRMGSFPGRAIGDQLDHAFERFSTWCQTHHHTPSVKSFERKTFKVKTPHGLIWFTYVPPIETEMIKILKGTKPQRSHANKRMYYVLLLPQHCLNI